MTETYTERELQIYQKGLKENITHMQSSPQTITFMQETKDQFKKINDKLKELPTKDSMELANERLIEKVMEKSEKKFASKLTEKVVYGLVGMILLGVFGKLLNLI